jgi:HSP20 family protein
MEFIKIRFGANFDPNDTGANRSTNGMFRSINPMFSLSEHAWKPPMDMYETPAQIIIRAEIAGVDREKLDVEINSRAVRIFAHRAELAPVSHATYRLAEIQYGDFERVLFLPAPIDADKVSASYRDGFLEIRLAKLPRGQAHKIEIADG